MKTIIANPPYKQQTHENIKRTIRRETNECRSCLIQQNNYVYR